MSEITPEELAQKMIDEEKRNREYLQKRVEVQRHRIDRDFSRLQQNKKLNSQINEEDLLKESPEYLKQVEQRHREYLTNIVKSRMVFVADMPEFNDAITFVQKELILVGAESGSGKSTCVANLAFQMLRNGKKPIILTNEETAEDVYSRIMALKDDKSYHKLASLSDEDREFFISSTKVLSPFVKVIDNSYNNLDSPTSSIEGLRAILNALKKSDQKYDALIIDYLQNFCNSIEYPEKPMWECMIVITEMLEDFRKFYPAPTVLFTQLKDKTKENEGLPFKNRIEQGKSIFNRCTTAIEIIASPKDLETEWVLHKSRFSNSKGNRFKTGWWSGRYVPLDQNFVDRRNKYREKQIANKLNKIKEM